jgi:hypothetical protein
MSKSPFWLRPFYPRHGGCSIRVGRGGADEGSRDPRGRVVERHRQARRGAEDRRRRGPAGRRFPLLLGGQPRSAITPPIR